MPTENPFRLFKEWFEDVQKLALEEPTAMTLATSTPDGHPSARIVLLKSYDERGFCFFTNITSQKGQELISNPHAALCFYWMQLHRQVRVQGRIERVSEKEADDYFASRRRGSQIGAWASKQSTAMQHADDLITRVQEITTQFEGQTIPRPPFWSGFRLVPERIEFWQEGEYRLHTRLVYTRTNDEDWTVTRLYP